MSSDKPCRVAIIGGGISGACCAARLSELSPSTSITLFDQGRRGPGGRASHRAVSGGAVLPDDPPIAEGALEFDHGCQFFRADSSEMQELASAWCAAGWAEPWRGRFGKIGAAPDFFGLPSSEKEVYVGVGGMHLLVRRLLASCSAEVKKGVRVAGMERAGDAWRLLGVAGEAAFHDTKDAAARAAARETLGVYDIVMLTDVSSSFGEWHRASAGVPEAFAAKVRGRVRLPLFSAMVAFEEPLGLALDGVAFEDEGLWFAARTQSKPGLGGGDAECWTLVSTPGFATREIAAEPMQDAKTGAFKPQEDGYLNSGPAPALLRAFLQRTEKEAPPVLYLQGQRWGSALPAPAGVEGRDECGEGESTLELMGVRYDAATPELVYEKEKKEEEDFLVEEGLGLYYAGDFTSRRNPGFEAAALAGRAAAGHLARRLAAG